MGTKRINLKMNKRVFLVSSLDKKSDEKKYWKSISNKERLLALEFLRQVFYGKNKLTKRLQRVLSVDELK